MCVQDESQSLATLLSSTILNFGPPKRVRVRNSFELQIDCTSRSVSSEGGRVSVHVRAFFCSSYSAPFIAYESRHAWVMRPCMCGWGQLFICSALPACIGGLYILHAKFCLQGVLNSLASLVPGHAS